MKPTRLGLQFAAASCLLAFAGGFYVSLMVLWGVFTTILVTLSLIDFARGLKRPPLVFERHCAHNLPVNVWTKVSLTVMSDARYLLHMDCYDHHPGTFLSRGMPVKLLLAPRDSAEVSYHVKPSKRGDAKFIGVEVMADSPLRLWQCKHFFELVDPVKVFPDFSKVIRYALLAADNRQSQLGIKLLIRRGEGNDFLQLREYREGDSMRQIDWKVSARLRKVISREYQDERDQQLVFMLDCGRRMRQHAGDLSHFDQTLNAMLLLSHVASSQGDAVGFMAFAGSERWLAPRKGRKTVRRILNSVYDLHSSKDAADYLLAAQRLLGLQRKRAMIIILTNTRDEDTAELQQAIALLGIRHRVILADLRESVLDEVSFQPVQSHSQALDYLTVNEYRGRRHKAHRFFRAQGGEVLDVTAAQLPAAMVNEYFRLKRAAG